MWTTMPPNSPAIPDPRARSKHAERRERMVAAFVAAREGDHSALDTLVQELTPMLWHLARSEGLDQQDAVDTVQNTWFALMNSLHSIRDPDGLLSWLITVTRRDAWRVRGTRRTELATQPELLDRSDRGPAVDERLLTDEERRRLWAAVGRLSRRCQQLLRIVAFVERPDYQVVSKALGMPVGSIGPTRGRCLAKLRHLLEAGGEGSWQ
jgi:RNA polymerase sigma factor (sigma-70 family)